MLTTGIHKKGATYYSVIDTGDIWPEGIPEDAAVRLECSVGDRRRYTWPLGEDLTAAAQGFLADVLWVTGPRHRG